MAADPVTIDVAANDAQPGDLPISVVTDPHHGTAVPTRGRTIVYTPRDAFTRDSFVYGYVDAGELAVPATVTVHRVDAIDDQAASIGGTPLRSTSSPTTWRPTG